MNRQYHYSVVVIIALMLANACQRVPSPPDPITRQTTYDLLAESGRAPAQFFLVATVDDSIRIKLDSVELVGLDGVLETWRLLAREAGINEVRHAIITTVQAENVLTDSGVVKMKMGRRDRIVIAERDTLLAFKSRWRVRNGEWRVVYEEMQRLSLPPSSK